MSRWSNFLKRAFLAATKTQGAKKRKFLPYFETLDERLVPAAPIINSSPTLTVLENAPYLYAFSATDGDGDAMFISSVGVPTWLSLTLGSNGNATLSGTPGDNNTGDFNITITVTDANNDSDFENFTITVTQVNDKPVRTAGTITNVLINEDASNTTAVSLGLTGLSYGNGGGTDENSPNQTITITLTSVPSYINLYKADDTTITSLPLTVTQTELQGLKYKTIADANGSGTPITWTVVDTGGTASGGVDTLTESLLITVNAVNDVPVRSGSLPAAVSVDEDSHNTSAVSLGLISITNYSVSGGTPESSQNLTITITSIPSFMTLYQGDGATTVNANTALSLLSFQALTYKTIANAAGTGNLQWQVRDDGGTANGGVDTLLESLGVTITGINDEPILTSAAAANISVLEDSNNTTAVSLGLGSLAYGPGGGSDETGQTLTYKITNIPSYITLWQANGTTQVLNNTTLTNLTALQGLKYKTIANANDAGSPSFLQWTITDNGGTANNGDNLLTDDILVAVTAINDQPTLTSAPPANIIVLEDSANITAVTMGFSSVTYGPGGGTAESGQSISLSFTSIPSYVNLFLSDGTTRVNQGTPLALAQFQGLKYKTIAEANGGSALVWAITDNGGTANSGINMLTGSMSLVVTAVNDAPSTNLPASPVVDNNPNALSPGTFQFSFSNYNVSETAGSATVTVVRVGGSTGTVTVGYATSNSTAIAGTDYTAASGTLTFANGVTSQSFAVSTSDQAGFQGDRRFTVTLSAPTGGAILGTSTAQVNIVDDESNSVSALEDSANSTAVSLNFGNLSYFSGGGTDESSQSLTINITSIPSYINLFQSNGTTPVTTGTILASIFQGLTYKTVANANGSGTLQWTVTDSGGTANGGVNSLSQSLPITVTAVNDAPTLTSGTITAVNVNEDSANTTAVSLGLTGIAYGKGGGGDETVQITTITITHIPSFINLYQADGTTTVTTGTVTVSVLGGLKYKTIADANGTDALTWTVADNGGTTNGGVDTSAVQSLSMTVNDVNDVPTLTAGTLPTISVLEDSNNTIAVTLTLSALTYGTGGGSAESDQNLFYTLTNVPNFINIYLDNGTTAVSANTILSLTDLRGLKYKTVANGFGTDNLIWTVQDDGGTASGGIDTRTESLTITVNGVNEIPVSSGTIPSITVNEDSANTTAVSVGLSSLSYTPGGGTFEASQTLTYKVTAIPSFINLYLSDGTTTVTAGSTLSGGLTDFQGLKYKTIANANGSGALTWTVQDNGGTANSGVDLLTESATITVTALNDAPVLTTGTITAINVNEDSNNTTAVTLGLTSIDYGRGGGSDETGQTLTINLTSIPSSIALFQSNGTTPVTTGTIQAADFLGLKYKTLANANGTGALTWTVQDNGGTAGGGVDTLAQSLTITVNAVNDAPTRTGGSLGSISVNEDSGNTTAVTLGLSGLTYGPGGGSDEASQTTIITVTSIPSTIALFQSDGTTAVAANSTLTLAQLLGLKYKTVADGANTTGTLTWSVSDNGGTANGGANTLTETLTISITGINDAPTRTAGTLPTLSILEDSATSTATSLGLSAFTYGKGGGADETIQNLTITVTTIPSTLTLFQADGTTTVTANTTLSQLQLQGLKYKTIADANGTGSIVWTVQDNGGTANGGNDLLTETLNITVTAVNDAPVRTGSLPTISVNEDSGNLTVQSLGLSSITDYTRGGGSGETSQALTITITSIPSNISLYQGDGTTTVTANTVLSLVSLQALTYKTIADVNGAGTLTWTVVDDGGTANGGVNTLTENLTITINSINDVPVRTVGTLPAISVNEDSANTTAVTLGLGSFIYGAGGSETQTLTYKVTAIPSFLSLFLADGTTPVTTATALTGGLTAFQGLKYKTAANQSGSGSLTWTVQDNGGTANGGVDTLTESATITVTAINDVPAVTAGSLASLTFAEDSANTTAVSLGLSTLAFGPGGGTDESTQNLTITVTTIPSFLTLFQADGTTTVSATNTLNGPQLQGLKYKTTADLAGSGTLTFTVQDNGGTANGGVDSLTANITVSVTALNDAPARTGGTLTTISVAEDSASSATSVGLGSVTYGPGGGADESSQTFTITITTIPSTIQLFQTDGTTTVTAGTTLTQPQFQGLKYKTVANANGSANLTWSVVDNGGTASGGVNTLSESLNVSVSAVNDAPTITLPLAAQSTNEDVLKSFTNGNALAISDPDSASLTVTLAVANGTLTLGSGSGATITTGTSLSFSGTTTQITSAISGLKYTPSSNYFGADNLTITASDGVAATTSATLALSVISVNDTPTFTATTLGSVSQGLGEQTIANFATFNSGASNEVQTPNYVISGISKPGVFLVPPAIDSTGTLTFTPANGIGSSKFTVTVEDSGGAQSASQTFTINIIKPTFSFTDGDGDKYTVSLAGSGGMVVTQATDGSIESIVLSNTNAEDSKLTIAVTKVGDGFVDVGAITSDSSLFSINAPKANLAGSGIAITGSISNITVRDVASTAQIEVQGRVKLVARNIDDANIATDGLLTLTANSVGAGSIEASGLASLTVAAGFAADVTLTGLTGSVATLGQVSITGGVSGGTWTVPGIAAGIKIKGEVDQWALNMTGGNLAYLIMDDVTQADVTIDGAVTGKVQVQRWAAGGLTAASLGSLTTTGKKATLTTPAIPGDFAVDLTLTATTGQALGKASIAGDLGSNSWQIGSSSGPIVVSGEVDGWTLNVDGSLTRLAVVNVATATVTVDSAITVLAAKNWAGGSIQANSIKTFTVKGTTASDFAGDLTLLGVGVTGDVLGTMSVQGAITGATINIAGNTSVISAGRVVDSSIFLAYNGSDFDSDFTLGTFNVKGITGVTDASFINSNVAAANLTAASLKSVDTSTACGFVVKTAQKIVIVGGAFAYPTDTSLDQFTITFV